MKVPTAIRKCVCFVGSRRLDGVVVPRGTAFFFARPLSTWPDRYLGFLITARHVIDGVRKSGQQLCLRLTVKTEPTFSAWVDVPLDDWVAHPDPTVDAAVMFMKTLHIFDMDAVFPAMALTKELIAAEEVGVGTEVFVTGLFVNHPGRDRNLPIVRVGNIAAMPEDKVYSEVFGEMDAFLIEARSIGGLSGSPVFAHLGAMKLKQNLATGKPDVVWAKTPEGVFYWMGLVHGHYDSSITSIDDAVGDTYATRERVNTGIAIVVPADRILEIFDVPSIKTLEEQAAQAAAEQLSKKCNAAD